MNNQFFSMILHLFKPHIVALRIYDIFWFLNCIKLITFSGYTYSKVVFYAIFYVGGVSTVYSELFNVHFTGETKEKVLFGWLFDCFCGEGIWIIFLF